MSSDRPPASTATFPVAPGESGPQPTRVGPLLDGAIFFCFALFAILLPHSIKGSQHAWQIAFVLWLVKLAVERRRPYPQPLSAPLLAYVTLSGISTALSPDPNLSWDRMKIVCLLLVGIVFAQNLQRLKQVRTLVFLLILSGLAAAGFTAWQYTYGVGVRVAYILPVVPLYQAHVVHDDIIQSIDGHRVHTPAELERIVAESVPGKWLSIHYVRGYPFHKKETMVTREQIVHSGLGTHWLQFARGRPFKAQGTLGHYVVFAEMLMQIGCMTWAMLLSIAPAEEGAATIARCHLRRADRGAFPDRDSRGAGRTGDRLLCRRTGARRQTLADLGGCRAVDPGAGIGDVDSPYARAAMAGHP